ncbi:MAG: hypothetical protein QXT26_07045 [Thermoproteota archaeon]
MESDEMPKCPNCGREIDHLINYVTNVTEEFRLFLTEDGEPDYQYVDTLLGGSESEYRCPECDEVLARTENDAVKFLRGDKG